jgi:hypothetical protein
MEAKIMHQTDWLMGEIGKYANTGRNYSINDDLQMAIGRLM